MGYRCRWIAMRGRDRDEVLKKLKFQVIAELAEEVYDPGLYAVEVEDWLVIVGDGWDFMDLVPRRLAGKLSNGGEVIYLYTDDSPMKSEITSFLDGQVQWSITYDGEDGVASPATEGTLPAAARKAIIAGEKAQREAGGPKAGVDHMYGITAKLGLELVGFAHDETLGSGNHVPIYQLKN
jgi:hypothetical protein